MRLLRIYKILQKYYNKSFKIISTKKEIQIISLGYVLALVLFLGKDFKKISLGEDFIFFIAHYAFFIKSLLNHSLPFWSPYSSLGIPEMFDSDFSYFSPGVIVVLIFNMVFNHSVDFNILGKSFQFVQYLQLFLGAVGMYLLLTRQFNINKIPAFLGGLVYAFAPLSTWDLTVISALNGKMLYPYIINILLSFIKNFSFKNFILLTICNYLIYSFGYPYHIIFMFFTEFLLVILFGLKSMLRFISVIILATLLSSFFLIPNYYYLKGAKGNPAFPSTDTTITQQISAPSSPLRIVNIINPQVYNNLFDKRDPNLLFTFSHFYWGVLPLIFLLVGFTAIRKEKIHIWLIMIFLLGIVYSLGKYLNIPGILEFIPQISSLRSIARIWLLPFFAGTIILALGADRALKGNNNKTIQLLLWFFVLMALLVLVFTPIFCDSCTTVNADLLINLSRSVVLLTIGLLLYYFIVKFKSKGLLVITIIITLCELSYYYKSDFREIARKRISYNDFLQKNSLIPEIPSKENLFRYYFDGNQFIYNTAQLFVFNFSSIESIPNMPLVNLVPHVGFEKAIQFANVKYVVSTNSALASMYPSFKLIKVIRPNEHPDEIFMSDIPDQPSFSEKSTNNHYIYKVDNYLPRFFVPKYVKSCRVGSDCYKEVPIVMTTIEDTINFSNRMDNKVILKVKEYKSSSITINAKASHKTFIASSEVFRNGWRIEINKKPATLYNINDGFRGFFIPAGRSDIYMYYIPEGLLLGITLTIIGLILLALLYIYKNAIFNKRNKYY